MRGSQHEYALLSGETLQRARGLFPFTAEGRIYLNHAGTSPLSTRVVNATEQYFKERSEGRLENYFQDIEMVTQCRSLVQRLINAESPDRIALACNTSDAINIVASGLPWKSGDRILLADLEFPANVYPYVNLKPSGVELDIVRSADGRVTTEMIAGTLSDRTRLVALSAVQFLSGYRADLAAIGEICRQRGIVFAVDGIQAVGAIAIDVQRMKIDALAAGAQKWQMAPHGSGFLYLTEDLQSRLHQQYLGWLSVDNPWDFYNYHQPLARSARRYEGGSLNIPSLWGMHASLTTLLEFGLDSIESHLLSLTQILLEGLRDIDGVSMQTPADPRERAGIVTISLPARAPQKNILRLLGDRRITAALREGKLRFSPHFYNTPGEMFEVCTTTREILTAALRQGPVANTIS
jgi:cysteine desulfurase / selenocysteine lyase